MLVAFHQHWMVAVFPDAPGRIRPENSVLIRNAQPDAVCRMVNPCKLDRRLSRCYKSVLTGFQAQSCDRVIRVVGSIGKRNLKKWAFLE